MINCINKPCVFSSMAGEDLISLRPQMSLISQLKLALTSQKCCNSNREYNVAFTSIITNIVGFLQYLNILSQCAW